MNIQIEGRYSQQNSFSDTIYRMFSIEEIAGVIKRGGRGMLSMNQYSIEGRLYTASGLSIGDETIPREHNGNIAVKTWFRRKYLAGQPAGADPEESILVDVIIDSTNDVFVTLVGGQLQTA